MGSDMELSGDIYTIVTVYDEVHVFLELLSIIN